MRIRTRISLTVVPLATVPLILVGLYSYRSLTNAFLEQIFLDEQRLCLMAATKLEREMDGCRDSLIQLTSVLAAEFDEHGGRTVGELLARPDNPIDEIAAGLATRHSPHMRIRILSSEGEELVAVNSRRDLADHRSAIQEPLFLKAAASAVLNRHISQFPPSEPVPGKTEATTFSAPIVYGRTLMGFVLVDYEVRALARILEETATISPGYYVLFDGGGNMIAEGGRSAVAEADALRLLYKSSHQRFYDAPQPFFVQTKYAVGGEHLYVSVRPVREYIAFKEPIPEERWYLAVFRSEIPALAAFRRTKRLFLTIFLLGLIVSILGTFYVSRQITTPIGELTAASKELAQGNLDVSISVSAKDELGQLASDFRTMASDLKRHIRDRQANETLVAIGRFSAALAHDLRNPVEGLKLLSRELCKRVGRGRAEGELAETIAQSVDSLSTLINKSMDFATLSSPFFVSVDLVVLAEKVIGSIRFGEVRLTAEYDSSLPRVKVDDAQIGRVLANLLTNAVEACQAARETEVCEVTLRLQSQGESVLIEVADTGPGIPMDIGERIFEPFFSTKPGGHGLGLALARQIIANHGGTITFATEEAKGTRFLVELPVVHGTDDVDARSAC